MAVAGGIRPSENVFRLVRGRPAACVASVFYLFGCLGFVLMFWLTVSFQTASQQALFRQRYRLPHRNDEMVEQPHVHQF